jgi:hypothetical protein
MRFKDAHLEGELKECSARLQDIAKVFAWVFAEETGKEALVTRVYDPVPGESGVHLAKRAVDFRDASSDGIDLANDAQTARIVERMNRLFPRNDKFPTCLHHHVPGSTDHFHIQIPIERT